MAQNTANFVGNSDISGISPTITGAINVLNSNKQGKTDNSLTTTAKTIVGGINEINSKLTNKQDKPTTGLISLGATDCVPPAVGISAYYQNNLLKGAKKVCVWCESLTIDLPAWIDTLDGSMDYASAIIDNTTPQSEGTSYDNNYWKAKLLIAFRKSWGGIYVNVQFMGASQSLSNLRVTKIYYEK